MRLNVTVRDMRTALVVVVPEAEPLVGRLREQYDHPRARLGVPAHVTLLFPFGDDADGLEELFAAAAPFDFSLARTARFAEQPILYLAPEPAEAFVRLIEALIARYPEFPPYGGSTRRDRPAPDRRLRGAGGRRGEPPAEPADPRPRGERDLARGGARRPLARAAPLRARG